MAMRRKLSRNRRMRPMWMSSQLPVQAVHCARVCCNCVHCLSNRTCVSPFGSICLTSAYFWGKQSTYSDSDSGQAGWLGIITITQFAFPFRLQPTGRIRCVFGCHNCLPPSGNTSSWWRATRPSRQAPAYASSLTTALTAQRANWHRHWTIRTWNARSM